MLLCSRRTPPLTNTFHSPLTSPHLSDLPGLADGWNVATRTFARHTVCLPVTRTIRGLHRRAVASHGGDVDRDWSGQTRRSSTTLRASQQGRMYGLGERFGCLGRYMRGLYGGRPRLTSERPRFRKKQCVGTSAASAGREPRHAAISCEIMTVSTRDLVSRPDSLLCKVIQLER
eukprot:5767154-Pyramimonas_sp.AAC.1